MAVYIDKDEIKRELINRAEELEQVESLDAVLRTAAIYMSLLYLELAKPKDVAPVVHAHWIVRSAEWRFQTECSKCGMGFEHMTQYCPYCGAKMDEEPER